MSFNALKYIDVVESALAVKCDIRELELRITDHMTALQWTLTKRVGMIVSTATVLFGVLVAATKFFSPQ